MFEPIKTSKLLRSIARGIVLWSLPLLGHTAAADMVSICGTPYGEDKTITVEINAKRR